ncbi:CoA transferase subunit A [Euzebya tangerina]|uniref:CoA transferase subunit A n=1 Tax=Euzebya tangerina TaxID=591198 RepID=UPI0013C35B9D|nr:CoA-transferase [Euzebya tangerina]
MSAASKAMGLAEALALIPDGCRLGIGGVLLQRKPVAFLRALVGAGRTGLHAHSFLASLDLEMLAASGRLASAHSGYCGFEQMGFAPAYLAGADNGDFEVHEYTEFLFVAGLRAALAGLPFMPAKGGIGSGALEELGYAMIECPYSGTPLVAVPAMEFDVTVIHAEAADEQGNVMGPAERDFLFDLDANMARAAKRCVVTVERVVPTSEIIGQRDRTLLFGYEVDAIVALPEGAAPTSLPGVYEADVSAIAEYLERVGRTPDYAETAMADLLSRSPAPLNTTRADPS